MSSVSSALKPVRLNFSRSTLAKSSAYQPRFYRKSMGNDRWKSFRSVYRETDLWIATDAGVNEESVENFTQERIRFYRQILDEFIVMHHEFRESLKPVKISEGVHPVIYEMGKAAEASGTGPMSAVAGALDVAAH